MKMIVAVVAVAGLGLFSVGCGVPTEKQSPRVQEVVAGCYQLGGTSLTEWVFGGVSVTCEIFVKP